ncbi:MAG TPA: type II toxin-antitoxin system RelE/ParE family toxin [Candidatus Saccharimonadales bacterium]|nr:type II toxin-antitoxin system RelE/ParE family toxin [Candidatus Saccharimonadales bacterium]
MEREIKEIQLENARSPFNEWFESLRDKKMQAAVDSRMARVRAGNFGVRKSVGEGVFELKIDVGPGLRVYYGEHEKKFVILLGGGDKSSQSRDIKHAIQLWHQWKVANKNASKKLQR